MFEIGDKIFYPMHGAGIVEAIEEKEILGEKQLYYILQMPLNNMQVMIPKAKISNLNIRGLVDSETMDTALASFQNERPEEPAVIPSQRYRHLMNKLKSGDIFEGVDVIRDLTQLSREKTLGNEDRSMLDNAQQLLISELVLSRDIEQERAEQLLSQALQKQA
ncbi:CarD family transcriptional regulator [Marinicrinis lubricantis]|uniref:CarD family transcriptional regulator n=1 Tax=Marinicrinis lubricantis TaxID=2086470 RepID=A0ABW1IVV0_9BACL